MIEPPYTDADYFDYVDGKKRYDGVASLMHSRNVEVPWGSVDDPPEAETVCGIGNRKNQAFASALRSEGIAPFPGLRQMAVEQGHVIAAGSWGKVKTVLQIAMVLALIAVDGSPAWVDALVYVTVVVTVYSGADYFFGFRALLNARPASARAASRR